jgi:hypothetical protein
MISIGLYGITKSEKIAGGAFIFGLACILINKL